MEITLEARGYWALFIGQRKQLRPTSRGCARVLCFAVRPPQWVSVLDGNLRRIVSGVKFILAPDQGFSGSGPVAASRKHAANSGALAKFREGEAISGV